MDLIKFIMWLSIGAIIGWFASRINGTQHKLQPIKVSNSDK